MAGNVSDGRGGGYRIMSAVVCPYCDVEVNPLTHRCFIEPPDRANPMTPKDSPTPEQLMKWKGAGVLVERRDSSRAKIWSQPQAIDGSTEWLHSLWCRGLVRVYRAPGHIQPHDRSAERPSHVGEDDRLTFHCAGKWSACITWARSIAKDSDYYIVLPRIKP